MESYAPVALQFLPESGHPDLDSFCLFCALCRHLQIHWSYHLHMFSKVLVSPDFSPRSDTEHIESMKVLSLSNEFREVMAVRVNQEKLGKGIT